MSTYWPESIPQIQDGKPANQATLNAPSDALKARTDWLRDRVEGLTNKEAVVVSNVVVSPQTAAGDIVYFNATRLRYEPAQAIWDSEYNTAGELVMSEQAYAAGIVVAKDSDTVADILVEGTWEDSSLATAMFSSGAGIYWLSAETAGKLVDTPPPLQVPCVVYLDDGTFSARLKAAAQPNHIHKIFTMEEDWYDVSDPLFDDMEVPVGAYKGYNIASDTNLSELFTSFHGELSVFMDGVWLDETSVVVNKDNVWWMEATGPTGSFRSVCYNPFLNGEPMLRSATTDTPDEIEISALNGILKVNKPAWVISDPVPSNKAISAISGKTISVTPCVSEVVAGAGINVSKTSQGKAIVSTATQVEAFRDADLVNLNNALQETDEPFIWYVLPNGRVSSMTGFCSTAKMPAGTYEVAAFAWVKGILGGTEGSPIVFPALDVTLTAVESPKPGEVSIAVPTQLSTAFGSVSSVQDKVYYLETPATGGRITAGSEAAIYVKIEGAADAYSKQIMRFGVIVYSVGVMSEGDYDEGDLEAVSTVLTYSSSNLIGIGGIIPAGSRILRASISVSEPFDGDSSTGAEPTVTLGTLADQDAIMEVSDSDLTTAGLYIKDLSLLLTADTQLVVAYSSDSATVGTASIVIEYLEA